MVSNGTIWSWTHSNLGKYIEGMTGACKALWSVFQKSLWCNLAEAEGDHVCWKPPTLLGEIYFGYPKHWVAHTSCGRTLKIPICSTAGDQRSGVRWVLFYSASQGSFSLKRRQNFGRASWHCCTLEWYTFQHQDNTASQLLGLWTAGS